MVHHHHHHIMKFLLVCFFCCFWMKTTVLSHRHDARIMGGETADHHEHPFIAAILIHENGTVVSTCAGAILSNNRILTVAHCIDGRTYQDITILVGVDNLEKEKHLKGQTKFADEDEEEDGFVTEKAEQKPSNTALRLLGVIYPPYYIADPARHDLAVLMIAPSITFTPQVQPSKLNDKLEVPVGMQILASGWGALQRHHGAPTSKMLRTLHLRTVPCNPAGQQTVYCANAHVGHGLCESDDGAPAVGREDGILYGVFVRSEQRSQCGLGYPDIFVNVAYYADWISAIL